MLTDTAKHQIREYLLQDPENKRGCIVTTDMDIIPFDNVSPTPSVHIACSLAGMAEMVKLMDSDILYGWAYSQPKWDPHPGVSDITSHFMATRMIIYSVPLDVFAVFENEQIKEMKTALISGAIR